MKRTLPTNGNVDALFLQSQFYLWVDLQVVLWHVRAIY